MRSALEAPWTITARTFPDLRDKFGTLGIRVPTRSEPKDQFAEEMYCLRRYLFPLADSGWLTFPITITKHEGPDFIRTGSGEDAVGVEVTKATREEYEADLTRFTRTGETKHYRSDKTAGTISLSEPGWVGEAVENEVAEYIVASIKEKVGDLDSYPVDPSDLLIYDNTPTVAPDLVKVAEAVRLKLRATPLRSATGRSFRAVSVIHDPVLIFDIEGACRMLSYKPEWGVA